MFNQVENTFRTRPRRGRNLNVLDLVRYGLIAFVGLGLYPTLFKKFNF